MKKCYIQFLLSESRVRRRAYEEHLLADGETVTLNNNSHEHKADCLV
jgi:hypothetical protein